MLLTFGHPEQHGEVAPSSRFLAATLHVPLPSGDICLSCSDLSLCLGLSGADPLPRTSSVYIASTALGNCDTASCVSSCISTTASGDYGRRSYHNPWVRVSRSQTFTFSFNPGEPPHGSTPSPLNSCLWSFISPLVISRTDPTPSRSTIGISASPVCLQCVVTGVGPPSGMALCGVTFHSHPRSCLRSTVLRSFYKGRGAHLSH